MRYGDEGEVTWLSEELRIDPMTLSGGRNACLLCGTIDERGRRGLTGVASIREVGREACRDVYVCDGRTESVN